MTNASVPTCSIEGCGAPGVYSFGTVEVPTGGEYVLKGTVADLSPELLIGLDPEDAATLGAMEVFDTVGGTVDRFEYWECATHGA